MSVLHCTVKQIKDGNMKNGNPYQRLCVVDGAGKEQWMPCFNGKMVKVGDKLIAEIKEGQYSEQYGQSYIIDDYVLEGGGTAAPVTGQESSSSAPTPEADTWRKKDLRISALALFRDIYPIDGDVKDSMDKAIRAAKYLEKTVNAYVAGADINEMKRNLADDVAEKVSNANSPEVAGEFDNIPQASTDQHPAFDDDIPF